MNKLITLKEVGQGIILGNESVVIFVEDEFEESTIEVKMAVDKEDYGEILLLVFFKENISTEDEIRIEMEKSTHKGLINELKNAGYSNIYFEKSDKDKTEKANELYLDYLYKLGVDKSIKLHDKDYRRLHEELIIEIGKKPELDKFIKSSFKNKQKMMDKIYKARNFASDLL